VSLNAREQKALKAIEIRLSESAPELAALLSAFSRVSAGEGMPDREQLRNGPRDLFRRFRVRLHFELSPGQYRRFRRIGLAVWLLATAAMIAVGAIFGSKGPHPACGQSLAMTCVSPTIGHHPAVPARRRTTPARH